MSLVVQLVGDTRTPEFLLPPFGFHDRHKGQKMTEWVKALPDRRWEPATKRWYITGTGGLLIDDFMDRHDLDLDRSGEPPELSGVDLSDLFVPKVRLDPEDSTAAHVRPMLVGKTRVQERLGFGAIWNKTLGYFQTPVTELIDLNGTPKRGLDVSADMLAAAARMRAPLDLDPAVEASASALATHIGSEDEGKTLSADAIKHLRIVSKHTGRLPSWFGLALFPFQECGAYAVAAGHNLLADEPGLGKGSPGSTKLLTPSGWTNYELVQPGDRVIGASGVPTTVTAKYDRGVLPVFRVRFNDGTSVLVDGDHLWQVNVAGQDFVEETRKLAAQVGFGVRPRIPMVAPVWFDETPADMEWLHVDPKERAKALARLLEGNSLSVGNRLYFEADDSGQVQHAMDAAMSLGGQCFFVEDEEGPTLELALPHWVDEITGLPSATPERHMVSIEPAGQERVYCISVEAEDQLYVTEWFIVTHNTRSALAAAAIRQSSRVIVVCPPLVLTNWAREIQSAFGPGIHEPGTPMYRPEPPPAPPMPEPRTKAEKKKAAAAAKKAAKEKKNFPEWICVMRAGPKKLPQVPDTGFVVVPDSLLSSRPELMAELLEWAAETAIFDEVHRARTWTSKRATACRTVASAVLERGGLTVPTTGTPILASPLELLNLLAMSGHLYRIWGSASDYIDKYLRPQKFGGFAPRKKELPGLGDVLREHVWTRRNKKDVLTQLPPKWRTVRRVEIDPKPFAEAHSALYEKLEAWVDEFGAENGRYPEEHDIDQFVQGRAIELMSPLRVAAGVAKIPAASEIVKTWMEDTTIVHEDGSREYTRPLIVWAHHKEVLQAMAQAIPEDLAAIGVISGATSSQRRSELADEFQAGKLGVLVCSIIAAGFGLTLTRSSDAIFIEQDWTPAQISQAEDRISRIGQLNPCMITTLYADNTLDPSLRAVLMNKGDILEAITPGSDNRVTKVTAIETQDAYEEFTGEDVELARSIKNVDEIVTGIIANILDSRVQSVSRRAA